MKRQLTINTLNLTYKNINLFSFYILKVYNCEKSSLCLHDMFRFPPWLEALGIDELYGLYGEFGLDLVNDFDLNRFSRSCSRFIRNFLQLDQNIRRYPHNFDVEYSFFELPLGFHQLNCFTFLSSRQANIICLSPLKGRSLKNLDQGVILKNLKNNSLFTDIVLGDTVIKIYNKVSLEILFMVVQKAHFSPSKNWLNWLEFARKNTLWYDDFSLVERSNLISDLGYKFDFIPMEGFIKRDDFYFYNSHSFGIDLVFPPSQSWFSEDCYMDVYRMLDNSVGEGLRKNFDLFSELHLIDMHFDLLIAKSLSERVRMWQKLLGTKK